MSKDLPKPVDENDLTLADYINLARSLLWAVNETLVHDGERSKVQQALRLPQTSLTHCAISALDSLKEIPELQETVATVGIPPGKGDALKKFCRCVLEHYDGGGVSLPYTAFTLKLPSQTVVGSAILAASTGHSGEQACPNKSANASST